MALRSSSRSKDKSVDRCPSRSDAARPWTNGDFTLVSSDDVSFKVDSLMLLGASAVFRGAIGVGTSSYSSEVVLTDPDIETATVLRMFLSIICTGALGPKYKSKRTITPRLRLNFTHVKHLIAFCDKYECQVARQTALLCVRDILHHEDLTPQELTEVFVLGALARDVETCADAISRRDFRSKSILTLARMEELPSEYVWALAHERGKRSNTTSAAVHFRTLVDLAERSNKVIPPYGRPLPMIDSCWTDGDIELVSSDNVSFKVQSFHIASASVSLRARIPTERQIVFDCTETETAAAIRMFLTLITTGYLALRVPGTMGNPNLQHVDTLTSFLVKYDCPAPLRTLMLHLRQLLAFDDSLALNMYFIGALANDPSTCIAAFEAGSRRQWDHSMHTSGDEAELPEDRQRIFNPRWWSYKLWRRLPPAYLFALLKASLHALPNVHDFDMRVQRNLKALVFGDQWRPVLWTRVFKPHMPSVLTPAPPPFGAPSTPGSASRLTDSRGSNWDNSDDNDEPYVATDSEMRSEFLDDDDEDQLDDDDGDVAGGEGGEAAANNGDPIESVTADEDEAEGGLGKGEGEGSGSAQSVIVVSDSDDDITEYETDSDDYETDSQASETQDNMLDMDREVRVPWEDDSEEGDEDEGDQEEENEDEEEEL